MRKNVASLNMHAPLSCHRASAHARMHATPNDKTLVRSLLFPRPSNISLIFSRRERGSAWLPPPLSIFRRTGLSVDGWSPFVPLTVLLSKSSLCSRVTPPNHLGNPSGDVMSCLDGDRCFWDDLSGIIRRRESSPRVAARQSRVCLHY